MRLKIPEGSVRTFEPASAGVHRLRIARFQGPTSREFTTKVGPMTVNHEYRLGATVVGGEEDGRWAWDSVDFDGLAVARCPLHGDNKVVRSGVALASCCLNKQINDGDAIDLPEELLNKEFFAEVQHTPRNDGKGVFTSIRNFRPID